MCKDHFIDYFLAGIEHDSDEEAIRILRITKAFLRALVEEICIVIETRLQEDYGQPEEEDDFSRIPF